MKNLFTICMTLFVTAFANAQSSAPDWTMDDLNGNSHSLYADYLDQGKTVFISLGAAWNMWDSVWLESGVLNDFHNTLSGDDAVVLFVEASSFTDEAALYGGGQNYDLVTGNDFPIFNAPDSFIDDYEVSHFPSIRIICPDGSMYSDNDISELGYGNFETAEDIANNMFLYCGTLFSDKNALHLQSFLDDNGDCDYQATESPIGDAKITIEGANSTTIRYTNDLGKTALLLNQGDYDVSLSPPNFLWSTCNSPSNISFQSTGEMASLDLGLEALQDCPLVTVNLSCAGLRRCFDSKIYVNFCNEGTETTGSTFIDVILPPELEYISSTYPLISSNGNTYTFELGELDPWECGQNIITVIPDCDVDLGTIQCMDVTVYPVATCDVGAHFDRECQEIVGSFDPNDKRAFPYMGSDEYTILPDTELRYQIRFQNTGTDTAFTVVVTDVISENLDLSSFRKLASSHSCEVEILVEERTLSFHFNDIMLPDSFVNEPASNGFVTFTFKQNPTLANGTLIENLADIFFDFNDPVRTNTTVHTVDDGVTSTKDFEEISFGLVPNPVEDRVTVNLIDEEWKNAKMEIYSLTGKLIRDYSLSTRKSIIDVSELNSGIYLVKLYNSDGAYGFKKMVVK